MTSLAVQAGPPGAVPAVMAQGAADQDGALASVLGGVWPAKSERGGSAGRIRVGAPDVLLGAPDVLPAFVGRVRGGSARKPHTRSKPIT